MKRKNFFTRLITLTMAVLLLVSCLAGCGGKTDNKKNGDTASSFRTVDEIKSSGKVVIGVFSDKAPFGYVDENGAYQGYDVYFAERIAKDLGVTRVRVVANKIRDEKDEDFVRSAIPAADLLGFIHYNTDIMDADRQGKSPYDFSPAAIEEIRKIKAILDRDESL